MASGLAPPANSNGYHRHPQSGEASSSSAMSTSASHAGRNSHHSHQRPQQSQQSQMSSRVANPRKDSAMQLKTTVLESFQPSKVYAEPLIKPPHTITSLAFDDRGEQLVSAGNDEQIHIWSCTKGKHLKTQYSKKYGVHLARFTHRNDSIIYASTKEDDTIRHHSLHKNEYLQYFRGHHAKVTSLQMSPVNDTFLSAAQNESVRLWDLRSPSCQGQFALQGRPIVAWDPAGDAFALGIGEAGVVLLYDVRKFSPEPFLVIRLSEHLASPQDFAEAPAPSFVTSLSFHSGGNMLLVGLAGDALLVADAYEGRVLYKLRGHECLREPDVRTPDIAACGQECGWTPDGRCVFASSHTRGIQFWQIPDYRPGQGIESPSMLSPIMALTKHPSPPARAVVFNPRFAMMASASRQVALWLPDLEDTEED